MRGARRKSLWKATLSIVVYAADEESARELVEAHMSDEAQNLVGQKVEVLQVKSPHDLPEHWDDAIPWGDDHRDLTCLQVLSQ